MMSSNELATIAGRALPIKILIFNNQGHAMCRQTQREWLGSEYPATSIEGGLTFPDFVKLGQAHGIPSFNININPVHYIQRMLESEGPCLLEATISPDADVVPKVKYGYPNEDGHPLLPLDEFHRQMIIPPLSRPL